MVSGTCEVPDVPAGIQNNSRNCALESGRCGPGGNGEMSGFFLLWNDDEQRVRTRTMKILALEKRA